MATRHASAFQRRQRSSRAGVGADPLLDSARNAPALKDGLVRRPELVRRLSETREAQLTLLVAPPGYGKSTLLAEWADHDERPFLWLALREHRLANTFQYRGSPTRASHVSLTQQVRRAVRRHRSFVVVLDDADLLNPAHLAEDVAAALRELPEESAVALASRSEPPLRLARLRAHRLLSELRMEHLAMTSAEAAALLRAAGIQPDFEQVQMLVGRTEGWPAALYLAALTRSGDAEDPVDFGGQHHLLLDYLRDEVLAVLPGELVAFSMQTSVVAELSARICDALLDRRGSGVELRRLSRLTPLLVPLDSAHTRYRWHTLMSEALQAELRRTDPELEHVLRRRAARWYVSCGDTQRAIAQSAVAGDPELTSDLLWPNVLGYLGRGESDLVRGWLSNFYGGQIADSAALALSTALTALVSGKVNEARRWSLTASAAHERHSSEDVQSISTAIKVIGAIDAHEGLAPMAELAAEATRLEPEESLWHPLCLLLGAIAVYLQGHSDDADRLLDRAARLSANRAPAVTSLCVAQRAMIAIEREDWELATELTDHASTMIEESGLTTDPLSSIVFASAAASRAHEGRIDEAKRDLRRGTELLAALGDFLPWYGAEARILLGHASLCLADAVAARTLLAEASRLGRRIPDAVIFSGWFNRAWAYMDTLAETSLAGPSSLTIAELRILRFLPSHRSFREIAAQLGVSANTVKTQAHAVYRKLGVTSRSEAVEQALDAGLISG